MNVKVCVTFTVQDDPYEYVEIVFAQTTQEARNIIESQLIQEFGNDYAIVSSELVDKG